MYWFNIVKREEFEECYEMAKPSLIAIIKNQRYVVTLVPKINEADDAEFYHLMNTLLEGSYPISYAAKNKIMKLRQDYIKCIKGEIPRDRKVDEGMMYG